MNSGGVAFGKAAGVTLVELVVVIVVLGALLAIGLPRLADSSALGPENFTDRTIAALRHAQRSAIAMRRTVCAEFGADSVSFSFARAEGSTSCDAPLTGPGGEAAYTVTASGGAAYASTPGSLSFDPLGRSSAAATIIVNGSARTITVEQETGYVRS